MQQLEIASEAVAAYFVKQGGDINDTGFTNYCDEETNLTGEIEIMRESYHELLNPILPKWTIWERFKLFNIMAILYF